MHAWQLPDSLKWGMPPAPQGAMSDPIHDIYVWIMGVVQSSNMQTHRKNDEINDPKNKAGEVLILRTSLFKVEPLI